MQTILVSNHDHFRKYPTYHNHPQCTSSKIYLRVHNYNLPSKRGMQVSKSWRLLSSNWIDLDNPDREGEAKIFEKVP
jgi:hypothetical protein